MKPTTSMADDTGVAADVLKLQGRLLQASDSSLITSVLTEVARQIPGVAWAEFLASSSEAAGHFAQPRLEHLTPLASSPPEGRSEPPSVAVQKREFVVATARQTYGVLHVGIAEPTGFAPYSPSLPALTQVAALRLENDLAGSLRATNLDLTRQVEVRTEDTRRSAARLESINECLLHLGPDHDKNLDALTAVCGQMLGAACALYNRLESDSLVSLGKWQAPAGLQTCTNPSGRLCHEVIRANREEALLIRNLPQTEFAVSDPSVLAYGLETYLGQVVRCQGQPVGALCVLFQRDFVPGDDDRRVLGILASAIGHEDERRSSAEAARSRQALLNSILQSVAEGILVVDAEGRVLAANRRFQELWRVPDPLVEFGKDEALLAHVVDQLAKPNQFTAEVQRLYGTQEENWCHLEFKDGRTFERYSRPITMDGRNCRLWSFRDITERKRNEEALRLSEQKFSRAFRSSPDAVLITSLADGRIRDVNQGFVRITGFTREEAVGKTTLELPLWAHAEDREAHLVELQTHGRVTGQEFRFRLKSGEILTGLVSAELVTFEGEPCSLAVARDISERKRATVALQKRDHLLQGVAEMMHLLIIDPDPQAAMPRVLALLGQAAEADRAYLMRGHLDPASGRLQTSPFCEWNHSRVGPRSGHPETRDPSCDALHLLLLEAFRQRRAFHQHVDPLEAGPRSVLEAQGVRSFLLLPVYVQEELWGFVGFDACQESRSWLEPEVAILNAASDSIGSAIGRRRAEDALRESEEKFRRLVDQPHDLVFRVDFEGRTTFVNAAARNVLGYEPEELLGRPCSLVLSEASAGQVAGSLLRRQTGELGFEPLVQEITLRRKDGTEFEGELRSAPILDANGRFHQIQGIVRDISQRKRMEEVLRQSQADLERAQAVGHVGSWISEPRPTAALNWSAETCRIFGVAETGFDARRETFYKLVHPEDVRRVQAAVQAAWRNEAPYDLEHRIVRPDGTVRWVHEKGEVECDATGAPRRMVGVVQDITEQRHLEEQLRQSQKLESIGQLAAGVAHDFNNILTIINGNASLLLNELDALDAAKEPLTEIIAAGERAANLTRQLLLFSRKQRMEPQKVHLNDVTGNLTKMLSRLLGEDITLELSYDPGLPLVNADPGMIEQVILNLAVNARDAMPRGGRLHIGTRAEQVSAAQTALNPDASEGLHVCLTVSDSGCGIPPEIRERVFEPFFTTKEVGKGTGLGLATVYGIVRQHHGWVELESEVDQGTTFRIFLPACQTSRDVGRPAFTVQTPRGRGETIMIVEDDAAVASLLRRILTRNGYQVVMVDSGAEARQVFHTLEKPADLVLTDMVMPGGVSGRELAETLWQTHPQLRVIFYSGYSPEITGSHVNLPHGVTFLQKPCSPSQVLAAIAQSLAPAGP